jgi:hypothetical protein
MLDREYRERPMKVALTGLVAMTVMASAASFVACIELEASPPEPTADAGADVGPLEGNTLSL